MSFLNCFVSIFEYLFLTCKFCFVYRFPNHFQKIMLIIWWFRYSHKPENYCVTFRFLGSAITSTYPMQDLGHITIAIMRALVQITEHYTLQTPLKGSNINLHYKIDSKKAEQKTTKIKQKQHSLQINMTKQQQVLQNKAKIIKPNSKMMGTNLKFVQDCYNILQHMKEHSINHYSIVNKSEISNNAIQITSSMSITTATIRNFTYQTNTKSNSMKIYVIKSEIWNIVIQVTFHPPEKC